MMQQGNDQNVSKDIEGSGVSLRTFFSACCHNWYWFVASLIVCCAVAMVYGYSRTKEYRGFAYILIKSDEKSGTATDMRIFSDLGIGNAASATDNEVYVIKSTRLLDMVVEDLGLSVQYYTKPMLAKVNIYGKSPILITPLSNPPKKSFKLRVIPKSDTEFEYYTESAEDPEWLTGTFGTKISIPAGLDIDENPLTCDITVTLTKEFSQGWIDKKIYAVVSDPHEKAIDFRDNLEVKRVEKETNVIGMTLDGQNYDMVIDFLDKLIEVYNQDVVADKNRVAVNTEKFIVDRIASIASDLGGIDSEIEVLKVRSNIPDASVTTALVSDGTRYKDAVAEVEVQIQLATYIKDYMASMQKYELIPANTGITDMGLEEQISQYNTDCLRYNKIAASSGAENPVTRDLDKSLSAMHDNITTSIDTYLNTLEIKLGQAKDQERKSQRMISSVPTQEKEITSIVRQQKIKEELYLYLLNKREENALQLAVTEPNAKIIEQAGGDDIPIYPSKMNIIILGFLVGLILPAVVIYIIFWSYSLDTKIHSRADLEAVSSLPIIGELPSKRKDQQNDEIIVTLNGRDRITEAMRIIRGNLSFMLSQGSTSAKVMQVTSTTPGEGKSYATANLALSCAHAGQKVILVDADLRKGGLSKLIKEYKGESHKGQKGLSAYLSQQPNTASQIELHDIIQTGALDENLDLITVGKLPPNPAFLLQTNRFKTMIDQLRNEYDMIFIDTVPYLIVADAQIVNTSVDTTIYVVRDGMVDRNYITELENLSQSGKINNLAFLITDVKMDSSRYGYSYASYGGYGGYGGYGDDEEKSKKKSKKKVS